MDQLILLQQQWMKILGPQISCSVIHPNTSCRYQILLKGLQTVKKSSKLYALVYMTMFLIQFRKIYRQRKVRKTIVSWSSDYVWSLLFMSWIVCGMKAAICLLNTMGFQLAGHCGPVLSIFASPSLYLLEKNKRYQVSFFAFVRSCRSIYIYFKKRYKFRLSNQKQLCFIFLYGLLSLFYFSKPQNIRNKNILQSLWGQF